MTEIHGDSTVKLAAPHVQITQTWPQGNTSTLHVERNDDLDIKAEAQQVLTNAKRGGMVIALALEAVQKVDKL